jgi:hypothetical protein
MAAMAPARSRSTVALALARLAVVLALGLLAVGLALATLSLAPVGAAQGESLRLEGRVVDAETGEPVPGAVLRAGGKSFGTEAGGGFAAEIDDREASTSPGCGGAWRTRGATPSARASVSTTSESRMGRPAPRFGMR